MTQAADSGTLTKDQERGLTPEQKAALEKQTKERAQELAKNKGLNDAFNAGMQAMTAKQYDVAVQQFTKASELDPNQNVVWAQLADAYIGLADTKTGAEHDDAMNKGLEAFQKALDAEAGRRGLSQQLRAGPGQGQEVRRSPGRARQGRHARPSERRKVLLQPRRSAGE